jgi:hypothetical protein
MTIFVIAGLDPAIHDETPRTLKCSMDAGSSPGMTIREHPIMGLQSHLTNSRIASSSPVSVSGYIRPAINCFSMRIEWV